MTYIPKMAYLLPYTWQEPANPLGRPSVKHVAYVANDLHYVLTDEEFREVAKLAVIFQIGIANVLDCTCLSFEQEEVLFVRFWEPAAKPAWLHDVGPFVGVKARRWTPPNGVTYGYHPDGRAVRTGRDV